MEPIHPVDIPMHEAIKVVVASVCMGVTWLVFFTLSSSDYSAVLVERVQEMREATGWLVNWLHWLF